MWQTLKNTLKEKDVQVLLVGISSLASGLIAGHVVASKQLEAKYEEISSDEIAKAKQFYKALYEKPSLDEMANKYGLEFIQDREPVESEEDPSSELEDEKAVEALTALRTYSGDVAQEQPVEEVEEVTVETTQKVKAVKKNVFETGRFKVREFDWPTEVEKRALIGNIDPYVITKDEFFSNDQDEETMSLTYFEGDDTLADEKDTPVNDVENTIGNDNLELFGYGSEDANIVYIRNPRIGMLMEVVHSDGEYTKEVAGFEHSDYEPRVRKFRGYHE